MSREAIALDTVLLLHTPEERWLPYPDAQVSYDTPEEAFHDEGRHYDQNPANMSSFKVCAHCKTVEDGPCGGHCTSELGYAESLWPCATYKTIIEALEQNK